MYSFMSLYQCWGDLAGFPSSFFMEMRIDLHKFWPAEQAFFNGNSKPINLLLEMSFWLVLTLCPMTRDDELILSCMPTTMGSCSIKIKHCAAKYAGFEDYINFEFLRFLY